MGTVGDDLTLVQERLHDSGTIWPRSELLRYYCDGYRQALAGSGAFSRLLPLDVPGRHSYAVSHSWETRHTSGGTWWFPMLTCYGGTRDVTAAWEVEHLDGVTPSAALVGLTFQWERSHTTETDRHFQFGLPTDHERVRRLEWNDRVLLPISVREFDEVDDAWMRRVGDPMWWTVGVGAVRSVEVYQITTAYIQAYQLIDPNTGIPREMSGDRTYTIEVDSYNPSNLYAYTNQGEMLLITDAIPAFLSGMGLRITDEPTDKSLGFYLFAWEGQQLNSETVTVLTTGGIIGSFPWESEFGSAEITFGIGGVRAIISPDRQYVPMVSEAAPYELLGGIRDFRSSADNLMAMEVVVPPTDLGEADRAVLIPEPIQKYLRFYVLSRAFGREGEGNRPDLAVHYDSRFQRGVALLRRFADTSHADRTFARQDTAGRSGTPPRVHLPTTFERTF